MKKIFGIYTLLLIIIAAPIALAAYALTAKSHSSGGRNVTITTQTATDLAGTKQDVLAAQQIGAYTSWTLTIFNSGANALTDLDILLGDENAEWDKAVINLTDAQPFATDFNSGCTTTLAADTKCVVGCDSCPVFAYIRAQATAGGASTVTTVKATLVGRIE